jgi:hypothetical protein
MKGSDEDLMEGITERMISARKVRDDKLIE